MTPRLRRFALTVHVLSSVGWLGAVVAFLALAIAGLVNRNVSTAGIYSAMQLIGWIVIVPFGLAALLSGLVQSLGTEWGLFRHYWVLWKFLLTSAAATLLLLHMRVVDRASTVAAGSVYSADFLPLQTRLVVDAGLAVLVLLATTTLSIYKPWGTTAYGRRQQPTLRNDVHGASVRDLRLSTRQPLVYVVAVIGVFAILVVLHLTGLVGHH